MTVSHLRQIHHQQLSAAMASSSSVIAQYRDGYTDCAAETVRYMEASRAYPTEMVMRMRHNLSSKAAFARDYQQTNACYGLPRAPADVTSTRDCRAVKVKVESPTSPTRTVSPDSGFDSVFSPLLMTVPMVKREKEPEPEMETNKNTSGCSSSDNSLYYTSSSNTTLNTSAECSTSDTSLETAQDSTGHSQEKSECKSSQGSVLALPSRVPVSVGDSPPQKQVWRPF